MAASSGINRPIDQNPLELERMAPTINLAQANKEHVLAVNRDYVAQPRITYRYAQFLIFQILNGDTFMKS